MVENIATYIIYRIKSILWDGLCINLCQTHAFIYHVFILTPLLACELCRVKGINISTRLFYTRIGNFKQKENRKARSTINDCNHDRCDGLMG